MANDSPEMADSPTTDSCNTLSKPKPQQNRRLKKRPSLLEMAKSMVKSIRPSSSIEPSPTRSDFSVRNPAEVSQQVSAVTSPTVESIPEEVEYDTNQESTVEHHYKSNYENEYENEYEDNYEDIDDEVHEYMQQQEDDSGLGLAGVQIQVASFIHPKEVRPIPRFHKSPLLPRSYNSSEDLNVIAFARKRGESRQYLTGDGAEELANRYPVDLAEQQRMFRGLLDATAVSNRKPKIVHFILQKAGITPMEWPPQHGEEPGDLEMLYKRRKYIDGVHFDIEGKIYFKRKELEDALRKENSQPQEHDESIGNNREFSLYGGHSRQSSHAVQLNTATSNSELDDAHNNVCLARAARHCAVEGEAKPWYSWLECYIKGQFNINNPPKILNLSPSYKFLMAVDSPTEEERIQASATYKSLWLSGLFQLPSDELNGLCQDLQTDCIYLSVFQNEKEIMTVLGGKVRRNEFDRCNSLNAHALYDTSMLVVHDTAKDWRFRCNPLVAAYKIGFFVAQPLITPKGDIWGVLSISGTEPRESFTHALRQDFAEAGQFISMALQEDSDKRDSYYEPPANGDNPRGHCRQESTLEYDLIPHALTLHKETPQLSAAMSNGLERFPDFDPSSGLVDSSMPHAERDWKNSYYSYQSALSIPSSRRFGSDIETVKCDQSSLTLKDSAIQPMRQLDTTSGDDFDGYCADGEVQGNLVALSSASQKYTSSFRRKASSLCDQAVGDSQYIAAYIAEILADEQNPNHQKVVFVGKAGSAESLTYADLGLLKDGLQQDRIVAWQRDSTDPRYQSYRSGDVIFVCTPDKAVSSKDRNVGFVAVGLRQHERHSSIARSHELTALAKLKSDFESLLSKAQHRANQRRTTGSQKRL